MKKTILVILLAFTQFAFGQVRVSLDNQLSVTFPVNPTKTKTDSLGYIYSANQNAGFYIATIKDISKQTPALDDDAAITHFYAEQMYNTLKKQNGKLVYKENLSIGDHNGFAFGYTLAASTFPDTRFERSVVLGKKLITFAFWTFKDKLTANTANRDVFFKSITKTNDTAPQVAYQASVKAIPADSSKTPAQQMSTKANFSRVGYTTGIIIGCLILTAFLMFILRLIIKNYKDKKN